MDANKLKTVLTVAIITVGALLTFVTVSSVSVSAYQSDGIIIDFGDRDVEWTEVDFHEYDKAIDALRYACGKNSFSLTVNDGIVTEIDGRTSTADGRVWTLWVIPEGGTAWQKCADTNVSSIGYGAIGWAYCSENEKPTVAVDQTGRSIYGYSQSYRTVTLSPSVSEIVGSVGAVKTIVGADKYSNYPLELVKMKEKNEVAIVGDYTTPNYEEIMKVNPDMVLCDGSQYNDLKVASKLRDSNVCAVVLYSGESIDTIIDNIYIVGVVLGYDIAAYQKINDLQYIFDTIENLIISSANHTARKVMVALSPDTSPWVSGGYTFISDIITKLTSNNVFLSFNGWVHLNDEQILAKNPDVIIVLNSDYSADQSEYDSMMNGLSDMWKKTTAFQEKNIYLVCESAGEMGQRPGPRFAQTMELVARILDPGVFTDISVPKYIGDDYHDYLTYSRYTE